MAQRKITSFFTSPSTSKPAAQKEILIEDNKELDKVKDTEDKRSNHDDGDTDEDVYIEEIENRRQNCNKSPTLTSISKPQVPTVTIKDEDTCCISDDEDSDDEVVQKSRSRAPKRVIDDDQDTIDLFEDTVKAQDSGIKRKSTPKRKPPAKVEDGIIGMKVRSPTNGRS